MTTTQSMTAAAICAPANALLGLGEALLAGIDPEKARCKPEGVDTNHPVFIFGHLAIYPDMVLGAIGRGDLADAKSEQWHEHFMHGKDCVCGCEDYPSLDEAVAFWKDRYETVIKAVSETDDSVFAKECPIEGLRSRCATVGELCNFMMIMHTSFHFGQLSAWRRCVGMSAAM